METIKADELKRRMDHNDDLLVLDVLPSEEHDKQHIPNAKNIPLKRDDFIDEVENAAESKVQQVVVYCANTGCDLSPKAAKQLEEAGFKNVVDFKGGIEEWKEAGYGVVGS